MIDEILASLSLEEKIKLLSGENAWHMEGLASFDLPGLTLTDGPHGVRLADEAAGEYFASKPATAFPIEAAMAATWNIDLIEEMAVHMGYESRFHGVQVLLGPGVNGKRSPLAGRNFEYFSEDPYLTGKMGTAFVKGVQSQGVGTSVKHYVGNEQETNRMVISSEIDSQALHEIYLKPFKMIVDEANPWTMMCAYNALNGVPLSRNPSLLIDILRNQWGYDGLVMSDWGAVWDKIESIKNCLDLEMPGPGKQDELAIQAYKDNALSMDSIDHRLRRVLALMMRSKKEFKPLKDYDFKKSHDIAKQVAAEAMVLLKNNGILPIKEKEAIGIIGEFAKKPRIQGGGSSHINPTVLNSFYKVMTQEKEIDYAAGYHGGQTNDELIKEALELAQSKDKVLLFVGTTELIEGEGFDRLDMKLPKGHRRLIDALIKVHDHIVLLNFSGSAVDLSAYTIDVAAIVQCWLPGQAGSEALRDLIYGQQNFSGKLSETFPLCLEHNPSYLSFPGSIDEVSYKESIFVGYRYYDTKKLPVLYPFGHGLSYTYFEYADLKVSSDEIIDDESLEVTVKITNTGDYSGQEVIQVYYGKPSAVVKRADKNLIKFKKVSLKSNESTTVKLLLKRDDFEFYSKKLKGMAVEEGHYQIFIGSSSRDIRLIKDIYIHSTDDVKEALSVNHSIRAFINDPEYGENILNIFNNLGFDKSNGLYEVMLGMPLKVALGIVQSFNLEEEKVEPLYQVIQSLQEKE